MPLRRRELVPARRPGQAASGPDRNGRRGLPVNGWGCEGRDAAIAGAGHRLREFRTPTPRRERATRRNSPLRLTSPAIAMNCTYRRLVRRSRPDVREFDLSVGRNHTRKSPADQRVQSLGLRRHCARPIIRATVGGPDQDHHDQSLGHGSQRFTSTVRTTFAQDGLGTACATANTQGVSIRSRTGGACHPYHCQRSPAVLAAICAKGCTARMIVDPSRASACSP